MSAIRSLQLWGRELVSDTQVGSENLEDPATTTAAGEPLPLDCDGEIDWTLFTFSHGFRQPRVAALAVRLVQHPASFLTSTMARAGLRSILEQCWSLRLRVVVATFSSAAQPQPRPLAQSC